MSRIVAAAVILAVLAGACGDGDAGGCTEVREPEDPTSFQHVIGGTDIVYLSHPPTSGPHASGAAVTGQVPEPLAEPVQVRILEAGNVLVQFDPARVDERPLAPLVEEGAVVAPGVDLPSPVVATAWTWKLTCDAVDTERLVRFLAERGDQAPGAD